MNTSNSGIILNEVKNIRTRLDEIQEKIQNLEQARETKTSEKILQKYDSDIKTNFIECLKESGSKGLEKHDIMTIFNVKETRAYEIQQELNKDYEWIEYKKRPGKAALTRHRKHAYAEEIAEQKAVNKEKVLEEVEKDGSDRTTIEILEEIHKDNESKSKRNTKTRAW